MQADNIQITQNNITALRRYEDAMRELNRFVKQNFGKSSREDGEVLSIAPVVKDIHKELDVLRKKITDYGRRNHSFLETGKYYKVTKTQHEVYYIHVLKMHHDGRKLNLEMISTCVYSDNSIHVSCQLEALKNALIDKSATEVIDAYYQGLVSEITEEQWNDLKDMFMKNASLLKTMMRSDVASETTDSEDDDADDDADDEYDSDEVYLEME